MWKWNLQITQKYTGGFDDHGITFALFHWLHIKMDTKLTKIELKNDSWGSSLTEIEKQMLSLSSIKYTINRIYARYISLDADVKQVNTWIKCNGSR